MHIINHIITTKLNYITICLTNGHLIANDLFRKCVLVLNKHNNFVIICFIYILNSKNK